MNKFELLPQQMGPPVEKINVDISKINALIDNYNAAPDSGKKQILIEIHYNYKDMLNKYPALSIGSETPFISRVLWEMFDIIQKEFNSQGLTSISAPNIEAFELLYVQANSNIALQNHFTSLLKNENEGIEYFFKDIKTLSAWKASTLDFIFHMAREDEYHQFYRDLNQLKNKLNLILSHPDLEAKGKSQLRELVTAINTKINRLVQEHPELKAKAESSLTEIISNMSPIVLREFMKHLANGDVDKLAKLYTKKEKNERKNLLEFLNTHSITFLGGFNSKNFKVTNTLTGKEYVLKIENRFFSPKTLEAQLYNVLPHTLITNHVERPGFLVDPTTNLKLPRSLILIDYCKGGDLESHSKKIQSAPNKITSALSIYKQMGEVVERMRKENIAFPDMKNSNWLIDEHGTIKIADTKSFFPCPNGELRPVSNDDFSFVLSPFMIPPEYNQKQQICNVDKAQAYMLGKNLYQYLTSCSNSYLRDKHDAAEYDFSDPVFFTSDGQELQTIIEALIKENPTERITVAEAVTRIKLVEQKIEIKKQVTEFYTDLDNMEAIVFLSQIRHATTVEALGEIRKELDQIKSSKVQQQQKSSDTMSNEVPKQEQAIETFKKIKQELGEITEGERRNEEIVPGPSGSKSS